jgi:disulfide bond formation protein DsbB
MNQYQDQSENQNGVPLIAAFVLIGAFVLVLALLLGGISPSAPTSAVQVADSSMSSTQIDSSIFRATATPIPPTPLPTEVPAVVVAVVPSYTEQQVREGGTIYQTTCSACHGMDARGVPFLGKDLIDSPFALGLTDEELLQFITVGRQPWDEGNTTGIAMPGRGGNPLLSDDQINLIIAYIRTQQMEAGFMPLQIASAPDLSAAGGSTEAPAVEPTIGGAELQPFVPIIEIPSSVEIVAQPFDPGTAYALSCAGCHGANGGGTTFNGGALPAELDEAELFAFLTEVRPYIMDGSFIHPVRGDYPSLTDDQLRELITYLQSIRQ